MKKNGILLNLFRILPIVLISCLLVLGIVSTNTFKAKATLIEPDDYEYVDTWDDSYLLDNIDGEQTIEAEGTPTGTISEGSGAGNKSGCSSVIVSPTAIGVFVALIGAFFVKSKIYK